MILRQLFKIISLIVVVLFVTNVSIAQSVVVPITVRDNTTGVGIDTFGVHKSATYCNDGNLGGGLEEVELPPKPPTGVFDARFTDHRSGPGACLGQGQRLHLQTWESSSVADTFKLEFQPGDGGYPMHLSWGSGLSANFSSLVMKDAFGLVINVNMLTDTLLDITNNAFASVLIYASPIANSVERENNLLPNVFALNQNYPNPFNPTTTIKFAIEKASIADIVIFDVMGRKVATLVSEQLNPGFYTTTWNGIDDRGNTVSSGVYYVRMNAHTGNNGTSSGESFSAFRKLLLMK